LVEKAQKCFYHNTQFGAPKLDLNPFW
jgi:hypothetical protein